VNVTTAPDYAMRCALAGAEAHREVLAIERALFGLVVQRRSVLASARGLVLSAEALDRDCVAAPNEPTVHAWTDEDDVGPPVVDVVADPVLRHAPPARALPLSTLGERAA
jgi:hypothetical protein